MMAGRQWKQMSHHTKNCLSCAANYENADRENTKQRADMWEWSGAVTKLCIKKQILYPRTAKTWWHKTHTSPTQLASHKNME